jgi:glycosyltransferase involved in cell wall biosynthesis
MTTVSPPPTTPAADAAPRPAVPSGRTRRERLLLTVHSAVRGGATLMALTQARFLREAYDLVIAVPPGPMRGAFAEIAPVVDGPPSLPIWTDSPAHWAWRGLRTGRDALALADLVRRREIDLVVTNSTVSLSPVVAARLAKVPVVVHARDTPFSRWAPALMRAHARLADVIVANGAQTASLFPATPRARLVRIADGIDIPATPVRRRMLGDGPLRLAIVGTLTHEKGQDVGIRALAALRRDGVDAELDLVGPEARPGDAARLRALAGDAGVGAHVHLRGETAGIEEALHGVDVVLVTSRGESAGLVAMEALARMVPVVASDVGGLREVIADRRTGRLVPVGDANAIADTLVELRRDPTATRAMAVRGRTDMQQRFARRASLEALSRELDRVLDAS